MLAAPAAAQHYQFRTDGSQRGYYDRPWLRYEAEPDLCASFQGETLAPPSPYSQAPLQADASRQTAITLAAQGDFVEWTADAEANALSLRFSLPDSPDGKGTKSTVAFYAGDEKLADIDLDSYWAWQYTQIAYSQDKYPDNIPDDSKFARMRFDEVYKLLDRAYRYIDLAKEDADFYNARNRKIQIINVLPLVEKARYMNLDNRRQRLQITNIIMIALVIAMIVVLWLFFRQMSKVRRARKEIEEQNRRVRDNRT